jgi:hypothetical protein
MRDFSIPDSKLCREARAASAAAVPVWLASHSERAFLLGRAYASHERIDFDEEALYVAALFHDIGLTETHLDTSQAFLETSSRVLSRFLDGRHVTPERASVMTEAIELHMRPWPSWSKGPVVALLHIGAWMDATGLRRSTVADDARLIAAQRPRDGFDGHFRSSVIKSIGSVRSCVGLMLPRRAVPVV